MLSNICTRHGTLRIRSNLCRIPIASSFFTYVNPNSPIPRFNSRNRKPTTVTNSTEFTLSLSSPEVSKISDCVSSSDVGSICSILSSFCGEKPNLDTLLDGFKGKLSSELVLRILMNYRNLGRRNTLEFFSWAGMQMRFQFDDSVVEYMADFLGRRKLFDDLKYLLITVSSNNCKVSCRTFSICIRFLGRKGRVKEALCLFEEMESKFNCKPNNLVFNNMLYVLCKKEASGHFIDVAIKIFRRIGSPDTYSYSNILVGLCKFGRYEAALELFHEMGLAGLAPTRSAANVLIGELCLLSEKAGAVDKVRVNHHRRPFDILVPNVSAKSGAIVPATRVFWAASKLGLLPSTFIIVRMVTELCRLGRMEEAVGVLDVVEGWKLRCAEDCYPIIIKALSERRFVSEVSQLFGRMLSHGIKPKLAVYNTIICMLCKLGNLNDAETVFKIMNKQRCPPNCLSYTALIHAYGEVQNWEAAYSLLTEMLGMGLRPHFHTCNLVYKLLRENDLMDLCVKLENKMEFLVLRSHCKQGELEAAHEKLRSMIEKGISIPIYVRNAFEHAFQKAGKLKIACELLDRTNKVVGC